MKDKLKFKKLLSEFRSLEAEFAYNTELLRESGEEFECTYLKWCEDNGVDIEALQKEKNKKVVIKQPTRSDKEDNYVAPPKEKQTKHKEMFKSVAKKLHPDKLNDEDPRKDEFNDAFLKANSAMDNGEWGGLFDVIDRYQIEIEDYGEVNESLSKDIKRMEGKLKSQKSTYAWHLQNCGDDPVCKEMVIQAYLKQVYGWDGTRKA